MFGKRHYPATYAPTFFNPFRGLVGGSLTLAGVIIIMNMFAPQALEQLLPNWKFQYGGLIVAGVILGFLRSIFRMFLPLASLGFWIVALFALTQGSVPSSFKLPSMASLGRAVTTASTPTVDTITNTKPIHGTRALPDSVYFPAPRSEGLGVLAEIPGLSLLKKSFR